MPELRFSTVLLYNCIIVQLYRYHRDKYKYTVTNTNINTGTARSYSAHPLGIIWITQNKTQMPLQIQTQIHLVQCISTREYMENRRKI